MPVPGVGNSTASQKPSALRPTKPETSSQMRPTSSLADADRATISNSSPPKKNWLSKTGEKIGGYFHNIGAQVSRRKGLAKIPGFVDGVMAPIDQLTDGIADGIAGKKSPEGRKLGRIITRAAVGAGIGFAIGGPVGAAIGAGIGILLGAFSNVDSNEPEAKQGEGAGTSQQSTVHDVPAGATQQTGQASAPIGTGTADRPVGGSQPQVAVSVSSVPAPAPNPAAPATSKTPAQECAGLITTNGATVQPRGDGKYKITINEGKGEFEFEGGGIFEGEEDEETNVLNINESVSLEKGKTYKLAGNVTRISPLGTEKAPAAKKAVESSKTEGSEDAEIWRIIFESMPEELAGQGQEDSIKSQTAKIKEILEDSNKNPDEKKENIIKILEDNLGDIGTLSEQWADDILLKYEFPD